MTNKTAKSWYIGNWSGLALIETLLKLAGLAAAIIALIQAFSGTPVSPTGTQLLQVLTLGILALGLVGAIGDRLIEREIIAMGFVLLNNIGHWGMVFALLRSPLPGALLLIFAGLFLLGDLVKVRWLLTSGFTVRNVPTRVLLALTLFYVAGYAFILLLALVGAQP